VLPFTIVLFAPGAEHRRISIGRGERFFVFSTIVGIRYIRSFFWAVTPMRHPFRGDNPFAADETQPKEQMTAIKCSLSVVMPAHNEEVAIVDTVGSVVNAVSAWTDDFEVIIVNDGSQDRTGAILDEIAVRDPRVRIIHHETNRGYGAALVSGFEATSKERVFFMDSDGQFDISDLERFFPFIERYDAVLGYRIDRQDTWVRKLNAWGWKMLVYLVFKLKVRDIDCAFKLYPGKFFREYRLETRGAMINTEILYKFKRAGYSYTEVGVRHLPRRGGRATGAKPAVIARAFREMFIYAHKWHREELQERHAPVGAGFIHPPE
jgi:glycosyltransferase involved in cell wall biosynthesis